MSSVVVASQRTVNTGEHATSPLVRDGLEWVPNVAHVFRQNQHLYFLYECMTGEAEGCEGRGDQGTDEYRVRHIRDEGVRDGAGDCGCLSMIRSMVRWCSSSMCRWRS